MLFRRLATVIPFMIGFALSSMSPVNGVLRSFDGRIQIRTETSWSNQLNTYISNDRGYGNSNGVGLKWKYDFIFDVVMPSNLDMARKLVEEHRLPQVLGLDDWQENENYTIEKDSSGKGLIFHLLCKDRRYDDIYLIDLGGAVIIFRLGLPEYESVSRSTRAREDGLREVKKLISKNSDQLKLVQKPAEGFQRDWIETPQNLEACFLSIDKIPDVKRNIKRIKNDNGILLDINHNWNVSLQNAHGLNCGSKLAKYFIKSGINDPSMMSFVILRGYLKHLRGEATDPNSLKEEIMKLAKEGKSALSPYCDNYQVPSSILEDEQRKELIQKGDDNGGH